MYVSKNIIFTEDSGFLECYILLLGKFSPMAQEYFSIQNHHC
jgi:hypothetical protein